MVEFVIKRVLFIVFFYFLHIMAIDNTNIDDYYSQIPLSNDGNKEEKKSTLKLKIKPKKAEDEVEKKEDSLEKKELDLNEPKEDKSKLKIKKQVNIITFEEKKEIKREEVKKEIKKEEIKEIKKDLKEPKEQKELKEYKEYKEYSQKPFEFKKKMPERRIFLNEPKEEKKDSNIISSSKPDFKKEKQIEIRENINLNKDNDKKLDSIEIKEKFWNNKKKNFWNKGQSDFKQKDDSWYWNRFKWGKKSFKIKWFLWEDEDNSNFRRSKKSFVGEKKKTDIDDLKQILTDKTGQEVSIPEFLTVKEFSEKIWVPFSKIIGEFLKNGMMVNLNTRVDYDTCFLISEVFGIKINKEQNSNFSITSLMEWNIVDILKNDDPTKRITRAPIISIMWHVDHGKTSILDYIRKTSVASWEAGWITQKIWAYQIEKNGKKITFLDTPWHEAFSIMRARWAKLTDIAIIVIAADEWMKPQTIESINHAKQAGTPIIVAINKMDKPGANIDFVKWQLAEQELHPEDWGGDTVVVPVSAHTWLWIDTLIEMILLVAEMQDLKADPSRPAIATVIESHLDSKLGPLATVLVNAWILKKWDAVVCASAFGRLKFLKDYKWRNVDEALPSQPILISWLSKVVEWWDILQVVNNAEESRQKAHEYELTKSSKSINQFEWASLELLLNRLKTWALKQLKLVVKADSNGSLEALKEALYKLSTNETKVHIIHSWVWEINDSDVIMSGTSQAILVWYNVWVIWNAKNTLQNSKIEVINKKVIYHILEKLEAIITWMIDIKHDDVDLWEAKVKAIFFTSKEKMVIGCELLTWKVENRSKIRVVRNWKKAWSWEIVNLKHWVVDVFEILDWEFGISFKWDVKVEVWDILEFYKIIQRK